MDNIVDIPKGSKTWYNSLIHQVCSICHEPGTWLTGYIESIDWNDEDYPIFGRINVIYYHRSKEELKHITILSVNICDIVSQKKENQLIYKIKHNL